MLPLLICALALSPLLISAQVTPKKVVCFYDSKSHYREDSGKFLVADIEHALGSCTHVVYGYAKLDGATFKVQPLDPDLDASEGKGNFKAVTGLKKRFPGLHVLLSVGGWADSTEDDKYLSLLRDGNSRGTFVTSARSLVTQYGFDGIDLAWQFPLVRVKQRSKLGSVWHKIKKTFGYAKGSKDPMAEDHRYGFVQLVKQLKLAFRPDGYLVTASVLPHTNYTLYWDVKELAPFLDSIHLQAFDFLTGESKITPEVADYPASLVQSNDRNPEFNGQFMVRWFTNQTAPANKLILGVPTYGRTWKLNDDSAASGIPPLEADGEGAGGHLTKKRGVLSYPEICTMMQNPQNLGTKGLLRKVSESTNLGTYAFRLEDSEREGLWVGFDDSEVINHKAEFVRTQGLGGISIHDLSMDDFRGVCSGERYPLLKAAKKGI